MNAEKLIFSLGPSGHDALDLFVGLLEGAARRNGFRMADFVQVLRRSDGPPASGAGGTDQAASAPLASAELCHNLPELPWIDGFVRPGEAGAPQGYDRSGLARKCWQEWVSRSVHDRSVPWFREIDAALTSLRSSSQRLGHSASGVVWAFIVANLTDPVEAALAYSLGRYLRTWTTADVQPVLLAVLAPREDTDQVVDFARGRAVAALEDLNRDWKQLGYRCAVLLDGRLSGGGHAVVRLTDEQQTSVLAQILYAAATDRLTREALLARDRDGDVEGVLWTTIAAAGYWFDREKYLKYAAIQLLLSASQPANETDAQLATRLNDGEWPPAPFPGDSAPASHAAIAQLAERLYDVLSNDIARIVATLNEIVAHAGYQELLAADAELNGPITGWPEAVADLVAIVQQAIVQPLEGSLQAAVEARLESLDDSVEQWVRGGFGDLALEGGLTPGTALLAALRLVERRLPELGRTARYRRDAARADEASDTQTHDRRLARLYRLLSSEARTTPSWSALGWRALLSGVLASAALLLTGTDWFGGLLPHPLEGLAGGTAAGIAVGVIELCWFVALRHRSCANLVTAIKQELDLRTKIVLNRMRSSALERYSQEIADQFRQAVSTAGPGSEQVQSGAATTAATVARTGTLASFGELLRKYANAWQIELQRQAAAMAALQQKWHDSGYLQRLPEAVLGDGPLCHLAEAELDAAVKRLNEVTTAASNPHSRLAAVRNCLTGEHGVWRHVLPNQLNAIPDALPGYFGRLVQTIAKHLDDAYFRNVSLNDLLRRLPAEQVRWFRGVDQSKTAELESADDAVRDAAKRRVLVQELFARATPPLALAGVQTRNVVWLSPSGSSRDDYLLSEAGLARRADNGSRQFTSDHSAAILLASSGPLRARDLLDGSGSFYRDLLSRVRKQYPHQPELVPISLELEGPS